MRYPRFNKREKRQLAIRTDSGQTTSAVDIRLAANETGNALTVTSATGVANVGDVFKLTTAGTLTALGGFSTGANSSFSTFSSGTHTLNDAANLAVGSTTGTKIATATTQKLGFWNVTPVVQPTGNVLTALTNTGLVASPTIAQADITGLTTALGALAPLASPTFTGTVTSGTFAGSGASLTSLPAAQLTGSIADARLSANVPLLNAANVFTTNQTINSNGTGTTTLVIKATAAQTAKLQEWRDNGSTVMGSMGPDGIMTAVSFVGSGSSLTSLPANVPASTQTLTDAATISWNADSGVVATVTLGGNRTISNPTNLKAGASYVLIAKQDGTGSRTLAYGNAYKWAGGATPTLSVAANAVDIISFLSDGTNLYGVIQTEFS